MSPEERENLETLRHRMLDNVDQGEDPTWMDVDTEGFQDVLAGNNRLDISHAGGEFMELARHLAAELR